MTLDVEGKINEIRKLINLGLSDKGVYNELQNENVTFELIKNVRKKYAQTSESAGSGSPSLLNEAKV